LALATAWVAGWVVVPPKYVKLLLSVKAAALPKSARKLLFDAATLQVIEPAEGIQTICCELVSAAPLRVKSTVALLLVATPILQDPPEEQVLAVMQLPVAGRSQTPAADGNAWPATGFLAFSCFSQPLNARSSDIAASDSTALR